MGRLLKKKVTTKKTKRDDTTLNPSSLVAIGNSSDIGIASSDTVKKQVVTQNKPPENKSAGIAEKAPYIGTAIQFLREVKAELKKVVWPSRKQTIGSTIVVIILVMIISLFLGVVDMGLSGLVHTILG